MKGQIIVISFDVESRGKSPSQHGILAVGICCGTTDGSVIMKKTWNVKPLNTRQFYEPRCLEEFWSKHTDLKKILETNAVEASVFAHEFRNMLNEWEKTHTIYLLCDNPTFDAGFINWYLDFFGLDSMQYSSDGQTFRSVHDGDSYARGYLQYPIKTPWISNESVFTHVNKKLVPIGTKHLPADDAGEIYRTHIALN